MKAKAPARLKELPAYSMAEAARYLGSNASTLRAWFQGRTYKTGGDQRWARPVLFRSGAKGTPISFLDLIEAHVLLAIRQGYRIPLSRFRTAMEYLKKSEGDLHFLAHRNFFHDNQDLFLHLDDKLVSLSERGQLVNREIIAEGLKQLVYGSDGYASRFFPRRGEGRQGIVVLDPTVNFGRPCIGRLGVGTEVLAKRFFSGETVSDIAQDYGATVEEVEESVRWHERVAA